MLYVFLQTTKNRSLLQLPCILKEAKTKRTFLGNPGQNFCGVFHIPAKFLFTTSEIKLGH